MFTTLGASNENMASGMYYTLGHLTKMWCLALRFRLKCQKISWKLVFSKLRAAQYSITTF